MDDQKLVPIFVCKTLPACPIRNACRKEGRCLGATGKVVVDDVGIDPTNWDDPDNARIATIKG